MQDLNLTLVQPAPKWHQIDANLDYYTRLLLHMNPATEVIVLPEMFTTGFTMDSATLAEEMGGKTHRWMQETAEELQAVICGSIIIEENDQYFNRFLWVEPNGSTRHYDKRHLFRMSDEDQHYTAGTETVVIDYQGWKIKPMICYDLRFPVWARNTVKDQQLEYDLLLYVANWPQPRISAWDALLKARAIENHAFCIGVNRIGTDEKGIAYTGHSAVYNTKGEQLLFAESEGLFMVTLSRQALTNYRKQFPAYLDSDRFNLQIES